MPENNARKRQARAIARAVGVPYTAALRHLDRRRTREAERLLPPGAAAGLLGRPAAVLASPIGSGPRLGHRLGHPVHRVRLVYGPPLVFVVTDTSAAAEPAALLVETLHDYLAQHRRRDPAAALAAVRAVTPEPVTVTYDGGSVLGQRIRLDGCRGVGFGAGGAVIVCCGPDGLDPALAAEHEVQDDRQPDDQAGRPEEAGQL